MEDQAVMVFSRRRGSHDQSENPALHGAPDGRKGPVVPGGSFSDVLRAAGGYQRDPGGGARNPLTIAFAIRSSGPDPSMSKRQ
jgi:hypothetical protein